MNQRKDSRFYEAWLEIKFHGEQPNHYEILGLRPYRVTPDELVNRMNRQKNRLETVRERGKDTTDFDAELHQRMVDEVINAGDCLSDSKRKSAYDRKLQRATLVTPRKANTIRERSQIELVEYSPPELPSSQFASLTENGTQHSSSKFSATPGKEATSWAPREILTLRNRPVLLLLLVTLPLVCFFASISRDSDLHSATLSPVPTEVIPKEELQAEEESMGWRSLQHALESPPIPEIDDSTDEFQDVDQAELATEVEPESEIAKIASPAQKPVALSKPVEQFITTAGGLPRNQVDASSQDSMVQLPSTVKHRIVTNPSLTATHERPTLSPDNAGWINSNDAPNSLWQPPLGLDDALSEQVILSSSPMVTDVVGRSMTREQKRFFATRLTAFIGRNWSSLTSRETMQTDWRELREMTSADPRLPFAVGLVFENSLRFDEALKWYEIARSTRPAIACFAPWRRSILLLLARRQGGDVEKALSLSVDYFHGLIEMSRFPNMSEFEPLLTRNIYFVGKLCGYLEQISKPHARWNSLNYQMEETEILANLRDLPGREKYLRLFTLGKQSINESYRSNRDYEVAANKANKEQADQTGTTEIKSTLTLKGKTEPVYGMEVDTPPLAVSSLLPPNYQSTQQREYETVIEKTHTRSQPYRKVQSNSENIRTYFSLNCESERRLLLQTFPRDYLPNRWSFVGARGTLGVSDQHDLADHPIDDDKLFVTRDRHPEETPVVHGSSPNNAARFDQ